MNAKRFAAAVFGLSVSVVIAAVAALPILLGGSPTGLVWIGGFLFVATVIVDTASDPVLGRCCRARRPTSGC